MQITFTSEEEHLLAVIGQYVLLPIFYWAVKRLFKVAAKTAEERVVEVVKASVKDNIDPFAKKLDGHIEAFERHIECDQQLAEDISKLSDKVDRVETILMSRRAVAPSMHLT